MEIKIIKIIDSTKWNINPISGFLTAPVVLARTGTQEYFRHELGFKDEPFKKVTVYRSPEEVFDEKSLKQYENLVITNEHPVDYVDVNNVKKLQVGSVSNIKQDGDYIKGLATVTDKKAISDIQNGKIELSVGYNSKLIKLNQDIEGKFCDFSQTAISPNHLALVKYGRCGGNCKFTDKKCNSPRKKCKRSIILEDDVPKLTIDGIEFEVEDKQLSQAIQKSFKNFDQEKEELKEKIDQEEKKKKKAIEEKDEVVKEKDKMQAEKDACGGTFKKKMKDVDLDKILLEDEDLNKLITDKVVKKAELVSTAKMILQDKMLEDLTCDRKIMEAVVLSEFKDKKLEDKSVDYIAALFDIAVKNFEKKQKSTNNLVGNFKDKKVIADKREEARTKYMKDHLKLEDN